MEIGISAAQAHEQAAAVELLHAALPPAARRARGATTLALIAGGEIDARGLLVARENGRLRGVQLAVPLPGAAGLMTPPEVRRPSDLELENRLVSAGVAFLTERG